MKMLQVMVMSFLFSICSAADLEFASQKLLYDMGISLSHQPQVVDITTAKEAMFGVYQEVEQVTQMIDLLIMIDDEFVSHDITTFEDLVRYEYQVNPHLMIAGALWIQEFQNLFVIFLQLHDGQDASFEVWCHDLQLHAELDEEDIDKLANPLYVDFLRAGFAMYRAERNLEKAFQQS